MAANRTFSIIKPDATRRNLTGAVTKMLEEAGLRVVASKRIQMTKEQAEGFYAVHKERPFYGGLIEFITSGPVVAMAWTGVDAISVARNLIGPTDGRTAAPGTIRGDFAMDIGHNVIHGSDGEDTASFELGLWFPEGLVDWTRDEESHIYE